MAIKIHNHAISFQLYKDNYFSSSCDNHFNSSTFADRYFVIESLYNGEVLNAYSSSEIGTNTKNGGDGQLWFWQQDSLRSKIYPEKAIEIDTTHSWKKVVLGSYQALSSQNFSFVIDEFGQKEIVSEYENLRLYVHQHDQVSGSQVGASIENGNIRQKWAWISNSGKVYIFLCLAFPSLVYLHS